MRLLLLADAEGGRQVSRLESASAGAMQQLEEEKRERTAQEEQLQATTANLNAQAASHLACCALFAMRGQALTCGWSE